MVIKAGTFVVGIVLLVLGLVLRAHYGPIHAACSSPLGQVAQTLGGQIPNCGLAGTAIDASWMMIAVGVITTLSGALALLKVLSGPSTDPKRSA